MLEIGQQLLTAPRGPVGERLVIDLGENRFELSLREKREDCLSHRGAMRRKPASNEQADVDDDVCLQPQDVDDRGAVKNGHVHGLADLSMELLKVRQSELWELEALQRSAPEE